MNKNEKYLNWKPKVISCTFRAMKNSLTSTNIYSSIYTLIRYKQLQKTVNCLQGNNSIKHNLSPSYFPTRKSQPQMVKKRPPKKGIITVGNAAKRLNTH